MLIYWMFVIYVDPKFRISSTSGKRFSKGTKGITNTFFSEIKDLSEPKLCIHIHWIKHLKILHFFCHSDIQLDSTTESYWTIPLTLIILIGNLCIIWEQRQFECCFLDVFVSSRNLKWLLSSKNVYIGYYLFLIY